MNRKEKENLIAAVAWLAVFLWTDAQYIKYFAVFSVGFVTAVLLTGYLQKGNK